MGKLEKVKENVWRYQTETRLLEFSFLEDEFGYWDGPINETARNNEGGGGIIPINKTNQLTFLKVEYPEFYPQFRALIEDYKNKQTNEI